MAPLFRLYLWPDRLLLLGPGFDTACHRHHAAQFCVGLEQALRWRQDLQADWNYAAAFFVPPDQPHQLDAGSGAVALLYLEAESLACAAALRRQPQASAYAFNDNAALAALRRIQRGDEKELDTALRGFGADLPAAVAESRDPRVTAALHWIGVHIDAPVRLAAVAAAVHLSASHFAHLFSAEIGVPLRRYVLWRRLRVALERAFAGDSLTAAAHAAGFADSAHLSRTFRDNFGVAPSFLFEQRQRVALRLCGSLGSPGEALG